jgi:cysteine desulfurase
MGWFVESGCVNNYNNDCRLIIFCFRSLIYIITILLLDMSQKKSTSKAKTTTKSSTPVPDTPTRRQIYLDNNGTTIMSQQTIATLVDWCNKGNPSGSYASAMLSKQMIDNFRHYIADGCGFTLDEGTISDNSASAPPTTNNKYAVVFTSCASESNCGFIRSVVDCYRRQQIASNNGGSISSILPHIVCGGTEHKSVIECCKQLAADKYAEVSIVPPDRLGFIQPTAIIATLRSNTALVIAMHVNNETGCFTDIKKIGKECVRRRIPFLCDVVQSFGKCPINPGAYGVTALSVSFHKIYGPPGIGCTIISSRFMQECRYTGQIAGSQQWGLRGGTENVPGIAASYCALRSTWTDRKSKNARLIELKKVFIAQLRKSNIKCISYQDYLAGKHSGTLIVIISANNASTTTYLPSTILLSVVKRVMLAPTQSTPATPMPVVTKDVCNAEMKKYLESKGIIVSIGSACNTKNKLASHVLFAMGLDDNMRKGILRISTSDFTSNEDVIVCANELTTFVKNNYLTS